MVDNVKPFSVLQFGKDLELVDDLPKAPFPYYLLAHEGMFVRGQSTLGRYLLPIKTIDRLDALGKNKGGLLWYDAPRVPAHIMAMAVDFFRHVYEQIKAEAEVLIFYNEDIEDENERFSLFVPNQVVSGGSVDSDYTDQMDDLPENSQLIGTMHSHCNMGAFHSPVDTKDASSFNGLHITIGHITDKIPEFDVIVSINKTNFPLKIARVANIEDINGYAAPNDEWMKFVTQEKPKSVVVVHTPDKQEFKPTYTYWNRTRWSSDFRRNIAIELWDGNDLSTFGFEYTLQEVLEEYRDLAKKNGVSLDFDINTDEPDDDTKASVEDEDEKDKDEDKSGLLVPKDFLNADHEEVDYVIAAENTGEPQPFLPGPFSMTDYLDENDLEAMAMAHFLRYGMQGERQEHEIPIPEIHRVQDRRGGRRRGRKQERKS